MTMTMMMINDANNGIVNAVNGSDDDNNKR